MPKRKLAYRLKVSSVVISTIYVVVEFLLMFGLLFQWPDFLNTGNFAYQNTTFSIVFILCLNISMICLYCRYAGYNYKSIEHQRNLKKIGCIAFYWTITLALKNIPYYLEFLDFDWQKPSNDDKDDQKTFSTLGIFLFFFTVSFFTESCATIFN